ncbi:MAG: SagB/ThcOx family dehydrogenase [Candidatus Dojkabacteria bacterium]
MDTLAFNLFWENSKLNRSNFPQFLANIERDDQKLHHYPQLLYPGKDIKLIEPQDPLANIQNQRRSNRLFSHKPLEESEIGSLLYASTSTTADLSLVPSAGGKYPVELFTLHFNTQGENNNSICYYNRDSHALTEVKDCPHWNKISPGMGIKLEHAPSLCIVLVGFPSRTTSKYGERGGRFLLIEAGHIAQNISLRAADSGLHGVECGGLFDDAFKKLLGLEKTEAVILLGYACGHGQKQL